MMVEKKSAVARTPARLTQKARDLKAAGISPALSDSTLLELSNFIARQVIYFPSGLRRLEMQLDADGNLKLQLDGVVKTDSALELETTLFTDKALTYERIVELVGSNNNCTAVSTELLTALIWKESGFKPAAINSGSSATGLMQVTKDAVDDVNANTPSGTHFSHSDMTDAEKNIQCGSYYLGLRIKRAGNVVKQGLEDYGTGAGYATNILACEKCLKGNPANPQLCLNAIHT
ncbi:transglycosylase SLT domain-containing protein [Undibacterium sp. Ren11W]|uniref:transglycosylase SLT domain-containing protein n=1 Tax=Undibacterium sp. Ren11W TaxID=3413045 RepID=UPI003BF2A240